MAKATKVKWALGGDEPDDLGEFLSNDDIVAKHKRKGEVLWPGKGPHTFKVKRLAIKDNKNGDPRISAMLVMANPDKVDASSWNGYLVWDGFNVVEGPSLSFLKRFLRALGLEWADFRDKTKAVADQDKQMIVQIGGVKFGEAAAKDPTVRALVVVKPADDFNDDEHLEIKSFLPADEPDEDDDDEEDEDEEVEVLDEDEDEDESEEDEDEDESEDEDEDEEDEEDEEEDEDEEDEDAVEELREELSGLTLAALKKRGIRSAKKAKVDYDDMPAKKKALVDWIVAVELDEPPF